MRGAVKHGDPSSRDGRGYDPNQPRVPAGDPDGGQWTSKGSGGGTNDPRVLSDATPDDHWIIGADYAAVGHHETPQQLFRKLRLRPETLREFDQAVSGPLGLRIVDRITGEPIVQHRWDKEHRAYNRAVGELFKMYLDGLQARGIVPEQMTPDHAQGIPQAHLSIARPTNSWLLGWHEIVAQAAPTARGGLGKAIVRVHTEARLRQERVELFKRLARTLRQFGRNWNDYFLFKERLWAYRHIVFTDSAPLLRSPAIRSLQRLLIDFPDWEIIIGVVNQESDFRGRTAVRVGVAGFASYHSRRCDHR